MAEIVIAGAIGATIAWVARQLHFLKHAKRNARFRAQSLPDSLDGALGSEDGWGRLSDLADERAAARRALTDPGFQLTVEELGSAPYRREEAERWRLADGAGRPMRSAILDRP
jgi:hypothetical protein